MGKQPITLKTSFKGLAGILFRKLIALIIAILACIIINRVKLFVEVKYNITGSIFKADILGSVVIIIVYIVLLIVILFLLAAAYKLFGVLYEMRRTTLIDFEKEVIEIKKYDFPYEREIVERRFNRIVGVEVSQKTIDRFLNCGTLYIEYLVLSKNDSKLRGIEIPFVENPFSIKALLMEE